MLRLKHIPIRTFGENAAFIRQENMMPHQAIQQKSCLEIRHKDRSVCAFLYPLIQPQIVALDEIGVDENTYKKLALPDGAEMEIGVIVPESRSFLHKKIQGDILTAGEYQIISEDIKKGCVSQVQLSGFLTAFVKYSALEEYGFLLASLIDKNGFFWDEYAIVSDYKIIGCQINNSMMELAVWLTTITYGIPSLKVLTPYDGYLIESLSSMTDLRWSDTTFQKILRQKHTCICLLESLNLCAVGMKMMQMYLPDEMDRALYITILLALEASIGVSHFVLEMVIGKNSTIKNAAEALKLKNLAEYLARQVGIRLKVIISDENVYSDNCNFEGVLGVLSQSSKCTSILCKNICRTARQVLEFDPNLSVGDGYKIVQKLLQSGKIYDQFENILKFQSQYRRM